MMLSMVARTSFISCRLAPSTTRPIGVPWPSVSRLRLTPDLPRSVGLLPAFFPAQSRLRQRPVHRQPVPVDPAQLIKLLHPSVPELEEHARFRPRLEAIMRRRMRAVLGLIQRLP